jgi:hypothetical protein
VIRFLNICNNTLFFYYLLSNIVYLLLLITAIIKSAAHRARLASLRLEHLSVSPFTPPVTLLAPAHNEEQFIVESARCSVSTIRTWK